MADDATTTDQQESRDADQQDTDSTDLQDAGKKALENERAARREADKRAKAVERELNDLKAAAQKAADDKAKEQGEWQQLAERRDAELTTATKSLEAVTTELDTLRQYVNADITAAVKDLPKALVAFDPGPDAPIAQRLDWLTKAKANAADLGAESVRIPKDKKPTPGGFDLEAEKLKARQSGRYRI